MRSAWHADHGPLRTMPASPEQSRLDIASRSARIVESHVSPGTLMYWSILAVAVGGALGSLFRWFLGLRLNALFPSLPLGTFASNVIAGYIIGVAVAGFARAPQIAPEWRLFVITGMMGGLSTFSTFSAEVVQHLQDGRLGWAAGEVAIHVGASLVMTILGIATVTLLSR